MLIAVSIARGNDAAPVTAADGGAEDKSAVGGSRAVLLCAAPDTMSALPSNERKCI
eukprot:EC726687.1.p4 GENE.EC726687.1~~EC726687.1.p4  ORF type:complete len:56 (-),score=3.27 EC726687.1:441-608(-)